MAQNNTITVDDLKVPLLAAVGVADLTLEQVSETVTAVRERAVEARTDARTRVDETRERLLKLQKDLPERRKELRARLTTEELRRYRGSATEQYKSLVERGESVLKERRGKTKKAAPAKKAVSSTKAPAKKAVSSTKAPAKKVAATVEQTATIEQ
ncbi:MAG: heparin-binding hemagglutinin [Actinomycetia bacterium]|nr:heparin-binding hemagglutinin [Actinomycetes bacterium]